MNLIKKRKKIVLISFMEIIYYCRKVDHMRENCREHLESSNEAENSLDEDNDDLLCTVIKMTTKGERKKKKVSFTNNVQFKVPHADLLLTFGCETSMMHSINRVLFYTFTKNI